MNGIGELATRGDLLNRSLVFKLPGLVTGREGSDLDAEFAAARPAVLGALLDDASAAFACRDAMPRDRLPRTADFAVWARRLARASGGSRGDFVDAYADNRADAVAVEIAASPVASALVDLMAETEGGQWTGTVCRPQARTRGTPRARSDRHGPSGFHCSLSKRLAL